MGSKREEAYERKATAASGTGKGWNILHAAGEEHGLACTSVLDFWLEDLFSIIRFHHFHYFKQLSLW